MIIVKRQKIEGNMEAITCGANYNLAPVKKTTFFLLPNFTFICTLIIKFFIIL